MNELETTNGAENDQRGLRILVVGVGGAGCHLADHAARSGMAGVEFLAANTDARALRAVVTASRLMLGAKITRGLGAGSDADIGRHAAEADEAAITRAFEGADLVVVCAGLGRGTGTGAAPVFARLAKKAGALVLGLVTMPFACEGLCRTDLARFGLQRLKSEADAVICLPNESIGRLFTESEDVSESFATADRLFGEALGGMVDLLTKPGMVPVDFADIAALFRNKHAEGSFALATGSGPDRAAEAVAGLAKHPLLDQGRAMKEAVAVLADVVAGPALPREEVQQVLRELTALCPAARVTINARVEPLFQEQMRVMVIISRAGVRPVEAVEAVPRNGNSVVFSSDADGHCEKAQEAPRPEKSRPRYVPPAPDYSQEKKEELLARQKGQSPRMGKRRQLWSQTTLPLEVISKGRFEKAERTIHQGQDLDVPAYLRRGVSLN